MKNILSLLFKSGIGISKKQYLYASSLNLIINIVFFLSFLMFLEDWNLIFATIVLVIMIIVPAGYISINLRIKRLKDLWYTKKNTFYFWFMLLWLRTNLMLLLDDWKQKNNINIPFFMWIIIAFVSIILFCILIMIIVKDLSILNNYFLLIRQTIGI